MLSAEALLKFCNAISEASGGRKIRTRVTVPALILSAKASSGEREAITSAILLFPATAARTGGPLSTFCT